MKRCFLIVDYSDTKKKKKILSDLILDIKSKGYDVFLSSHVNHTSNITKLVDYFYFDKDNNLNYEYKYKLQKVFGNDKFVVRYKPLNKFSTHGFAIMSITLPPLNLLKSLGYEIVHKIEYDNLFKNWEFIKEFESKLETYDIIGQKRFYDDINQTKGIFTLSGEFWSLNLKNIDYNHFKYDYLEYKNCFNNCIPKYQSVIFEYVIHEKFVSHLNYFAYEENYLDSFLHKNLISSVGNVSDTIGNNFCFCKNRNNELYFYINNLTTENISGNRKEYTKLIFDENIILNITTNPNSWNIIPIKPNFTNVEIEISGKNYGKLNINSDYIQTNILNIYN